MFNKHINLDKEYSIIGACACGNYPYAFENESDLIELAIAGRPFCRKALAGGITVSDDGQIVVSVPEDQEANGHDDKILVLESNKTKIEIPVMKYDYEARNWLYSLHGDEQEAAFDLLDAMFCADAKTVDKPNWLNWRAMDNAKK